MKVEAAFAISILSYKVENWSEHKDEIIDMLDTEECDGHQTDYFKYHQEGKVPPYADKLFKILQPALKEFDQAYPRKFDIQYRTCSPELTGRTFQKLYLHQGYVQELLYNYFFPPMQYYLQM